MRAADFLNKLLAVAIPVTLLPGCNLLPTDPDATADPEVAAWEAGTDLTSEFGGYEFTDEPAAFGDVEVQKIEAEENSVAIADEDSVVEPGSFALRILWGQLRGNRDAEAIVDWSGKIAVSDGALGVLRTIAFEMPSDHLLPRENRVQIGFVSKTRPHFDGLLLVVRGHPEAMLTIDTAPFTGSWSLRELREIDAVFAVDDLGNAVSVEAIEIDATCPNGAVRGHWVQREGERGVFRGVWLTALGRAIGHIRGHFGVNDEGRSVWFAKIIQRDGRVIGLARGEWVPSDDPERPGGRFAGHWVTRDGVRRGSVAGHYVPARRGEDGVGGFFQGRWRSLCDQPEPDPTDEPRD